MTALCNICGRGASNCECDEPEGPSVKECVDCGESLSRVDIANGYRTCHVCAGIRRQVRWDLGPKANP